MLNSFQHPFHNPNGAKQHEAPTLQPRIDATARLYGEPVLMSDNGETIGECQRHEEIKALARFEVDGAAESRSKQIDQHNAAFRWMLASLFALNGGGILSLLGAVGLATQASFGAFCVFFLGVIATFGSAILAQLSDQKMIKQMHNWGRYWSTVSVTCTRDEEYEEKVEKQIIEAESYGHSARVWGFFAMVFFVLGVLTVVVLAQKAELRKLETDVEILSEKFR